MAVPVRVTLSWAVAVAVRSTAPPPQRAFSLRVSPPIFYLAAAFPTRKKKISNSPPQRATLTRFRRLLPVDLPHLPPANPSPAPEIYSARAAMAETLDMTLDDIIKNNKKSNSSSGGGRRSRGGSAPGGGGGGGSGGVGPTRRPFKRAGNRQAPYQPPKVRTNRTGCCSASPGGGCGGFGLR